MSDINILQAFLRAAPVNCQHAGGVDNEMKRYCPLQSTCQVGNGIPIRQIERQVTATRRFYHGATSWIVAERRGHG